MLLIFQKFTSHWSRLTKRSSGTLLELTQTFPLNPKVNIPPFVATVTAALQIYQVDPIHQSWGLKAKNFLGCKPHWM